MDLKTQADADLASALGLGESLEAFFAKYPKPVAPRRPVSKYEVSVLLDSDLLSGELGVFFSTRGKSRPATDFDAAELPEIIIEQVTLTGHDGTVIDLPFGMFSVASWQMLEDECARFLDEDMS